MLALRFQFCLLPTHSWSKLAAECAQAFQCKLIAVVSWHHWLFWYQFGTISKKYTFEKYMNYSIKLSRSAIWQCPFKFNSCGFLKVAGDICSIGNVHGRETLIIMSKVDEQMQGELNELLSFLSEKYSLIFSLYEDIQKKEKKSESRRQPQETSKFCVAK